MYVLKDTTTVSLDNATVEEQALQPLPPKKVGYKHSLKMLMRVHAKKTMIKGHIHATIFVKDAHKEIIPLLIDLKKTPTFNHAKWLKPVQMKPKVPGLIKLMILAFMGGFFLNFMPCVLPMLSIKVIAFSSRYSSPFLAALCNMGGTIFIFLTFGSMLAIFKSTLSIGFQMQSPYFVMGLAFLFALITLSLFQVIRLPFYNLVTPRLHSQYLDSFMNGVLTTIVAAPCTGPYVGIALGYSLSQPVLVILLVFLCLGIGMSLPVLFSVFFSYKVVASVSKSYGLWIETVQKAIGFLCMMTTIWFLYVLSGLVSNESLFLVLGTLVVLCFGAFFKLRTVMIISIIVGAYVVYKRDFFEMHPHNVALEAVKKPVIVSFVARWCLNCIKNKRLFHQYEQWFKEKGIQIIYVDVTKEFPPLFYKYKALGIPFNVLIAADGEEIVLPEHLTMRDLHRLFP